MLQTYTNSYNYVLKAELLGLTEHYIYYWKAFFLNSINKHTDALEQINIAISKDPNNANYYDLRAQIKQILGAANWEQESNIDYKKSSQLYYSGKIKALKIQAYNPTYFPKIMFRIRDYRLGQLYPSISDTVYLQENSTKLTCKEIENIELNNKIILHSVATKTYHNSSKIPKEYKKHLKRRKIVESSRIASIDLMNDTVNGLVFGFYQTSGCAENTKTILIKRGLEQMTLEIAGFFSGSPSDILLDGIPFQNEKSTIDFSKILNIKRNDNGSYQTVVKNYETNTYQINPKLIRDFYKSPHDMQDFVSVNMFYNHWLSYLRKENYYKNDTTFYYYSDSLPNLFCKGVYKKFRHVSKRGKRHFTDPGFREHYRRVTKQIYRYGSWRYYDIDGNILLESHYKKKKVFAFKNNKTIPIGIWKYYEKGKLTMTEEYLPNNRFKITKY